MRTKGKTYDGEKTKQDATMTPSEDNLPFHPANMVVNAEGVPKAPYQVIIMHYF